MDGSKWMWFEQHVLSILVFLPFFWGLLGLGFKKNKLWSLLGTLLTFGVSIVLLMRYLPEGAEFQFVETKTWIPALGIQYQLGVDGISVWLILLTTFLMPIVVLSSFTAVETKQRAFYFLLLFLESAMLGAFSALDVFLFYVFWEAMLIPMYFLIGIWGSKDRIYAATKFFLYTLVGSLLMLVAIFYLAHQHSVQFGHYSMSIPDLYRVKTDSVGGYFSPQSWLFLAFALAFAIKVPLFPLHTWLPDAHVQAPTAGSVILAGVLLKLGGYGFIRLAFPLFPEAVQLFQGPMIVLSAIAILYGAWVATVQPDIKKLVAYSSVSHMGYVVLGLFSLNTIGAMGSIYQMLNHGIATGGLFLLVGMLYERRHTREISEFGGLSRVMPLYAIALVILMLSSVALPGTNGFVGEFLILLGSWQARPFWSAVSALGVIFGAVYMLLMVQKVMFGKIVKEENKSLKDLSLREVMVLLPLVFMVFFMGIKPGVFFKSLEPSVHRLVARVQNTHQSTPTQTAMILPKGSSP